MTQEMYELKIIVDGKELVLTCENDMSFQSVKEALFQAIRYVGNAEDKIKQNQLQSNEVGP